MNSLVRACFGVVISLILLLNCGGALQVEPTLDSPTEKAATTAAMPVVPASPTPTVRSQALHHAEGAGRWYPADPLKLRASVAAYVSQASVRPIPGRLLAVIVPHAGYLYSGGVAGYAFRAMKDAGCADRTVVVVGDTHTGNGSAQIAVWAEGAFETPLGAISVDEAAARSIVAADERIEFDRDAFRAEHPVENQLPFVKVVCPGAPIVPVVIRNPSLQNADLLARVLVRAFGESVPLVVASTDLSHYHPYEEARQIDQVALQAIESLDPQAVIESPQRCTELGIAEQPTTMCSQGAVLTAIMFASKMIAGVAAPDDTLHADVLYYANSGDVPTGERESVVGYAAVVLWQDGMRAPAADGFELAFAPYESPDPVPLTPVVQDELLSLARTTVSQYLSTESVPLYRTEDPALLQPMGAYVTYEHEGALRGCLGRLQGDRPAYLNVQYAALAAALGDPRFPPISSAELEELTIEITLLQPMRPIESARDIQIGSDGVLMEVGEDGRAVFLPQVPIEEGWDLEATLVNLCRKAGLPDDAWKRPDARFYAFSGQWFGEDGH